MNRSRRFAQVDVFSNEPLRGNPLAVVVDGEGLSDAQMARFARWTNLSETTFLLPPTDPAADYRLRIFTPGGELPFAGHPTLGSAQVWLDHGGRPRQPGLIVQQCQIGLIPVRQVAGQEGRLAFAAPPLTREGPLASELRAQVLRALRLPEAEALDVVWVSNGPEWIAVRVARAAQVLALQPDFAAMAGLNVGVVGAHEPGAEAQFEVRMFVPEMGVPEDPVTGSFNAGLALWMMATGLAPERYTVAQGTQLQRQGRIHISREGEQTWIGGDVQRLIAGKLQL
ncbi:PhzF family phenazine biosynthesis protein [Paucibacter sp. APW11]|uniref:PhzF family phenazine biosynthesis protein n=1 Tax=Roseateles aquae TaxID=3077235 RepID=A0ABU3PBX8_9BURK|nr:PhzF family phenazine biosynthesis protein [Paucibacter sp. APW11]MDT9000066.1 PhzF family phenazine biosynthesis protein [Paucibacter sp. APW11]